MKDITAHTMEYNGGLIESSIELEQYMDIYYGEYNCF